MSRFFTNTDKRRVARKATLHGNLKCGLCHERFQDMTPSGFCPECDERIAAQSRDDQQVVLADKIAQRAQKWSGPRG